MQEIAEVNTAFNHKPFNATSNQHKKFLAAYCDKVKLLQQENAHLDFNSRT